MKCVYVLTSSEKDYYYEQCLISLMSLKQYNQNSDVIILTDDVTAKGLKGFRGRIKEYANVKEIHLKPKYNQKVRSRILKSSMRDFVEGDFVFIDLDTVITGSLDGIENGIENIGMVLDKHVKVNEHYMYMFMYMFMNAEKMGYSASYEDKHFNSGVIYVRDTPISHEFFKLWNALYLECYENGIDIDQTSLNEANCRMDGVIQEMDGVWNVQVNAGLRYISEAKILHYLGYQPLNSQNIYFNTLPFLLCDGDLLFRMKQEESVSEEILSIIDNPKRAFKVVAIIPEDCAAYRLIFSNHMRVLKFIYVKCHGIYKGMEKIYSFIFKKMFGRV